MQDARQIVQTVLAALEEKKGSDTVILDIQDVSLITDYFIIVTGNSNTHLQALARHCEEKVEEKGLRPLRVEGFREAQWILQDYGSVVVHFFLKEQRAFYNLERLWGDAKMLTELP